MKSLEKILENRCIRNHKTVFPAHEAEIGLPDCGICRVIWERVNGYEHVAASPQDPGSQNKYLLPTRTDMRALKDIFFGDEEVEYKFILKTLNKRNRYDEKINMQYKQLLFLTYKDGAPMLTIGGILVDDVLKEKIDNTNVLEKLVYCSFGDKYFSIEIPKLTYKEIQVVLKNIPITDEEYEKNKDNFYGIELDEIRKFEKIYRYYPYYTEGCLNT